MKKDKMFNTLDILSKRKRQLRIAREYNKAEQVLTADPEKIVDITHLLILLDGKISEIELTECTLENIFYGEEPFKEKGC